MAIKIHMRFSRVFFVFCACILFIRPLVGEVEAATYYVDSAGGNDGNSGTNPNAAWQTLNKVDGTTFSAGDKVLLKAGGSWTGRLSPLGSGATNNPIIIDMYGTGPKPIIDGNGLTGTGVVYLLNQQFWEINNLEIIDNAGNGGETNRSRLQAATEKPPIR